MSLFRRDRPGQVRRGDSEDVRHLREFAANHPGVEAFVEPPTTVTATTVVFVAGSGEWTRRRIADAATAHSLANALAVPSYDAVVVGYPQRMREWNARQKLTEQQRRSPEQ